MKKITILLFLSMLIFSCSDDDTNPDPEPPIIDPEVPVENTDTLTYIYDIEALPEVKMEIPLEEWNKLLSYYDQNPDNEEYVKGNFMFTKNGVTDTLPNIGLRVRGNTSRRRPEGSYGQTHNVQNPDWHHASFAISFKKYDKLQTYRNAEKINLKWFKDDAMYVREVYCYDLFERFGVWTAPQSSYCRLTIKVTGDTKAAYYGVYQLVEPIDEAYLANRKASFKNDSGNLWKANSGANLKSADKGQMGVEDVTLTNTYTPVYDLKTNKKQLEAAKTQLATFITELNNKSGTELKTWIDQKMDVELFLKTYAVNVICGMWDDYWANSNNYYFYFDAQGKFYFIPYDYDNTLGTSLIMNDSGRQNLLEWGGNNGHPLVSKVISIPEYRTMYINFLHELADSSKDYFHADRSAVRIKLWQNMIKNYISNDTGEDMTIQDKPASWGNQPNYRLLGGSNNFFIIRAANLPNK